MPERGNANQEMNMERVRVECGRADWVSKYHLDELIILMLNLLPLALPYPLHTHLSILTTPPTNFKSSFSFNFLLISVPCILASSSAHHSDQQDLSIYLPPNSIFHIGNATDTRQFCSINGKEKWLNKWMNGNKRKLRNLSSQSLEENKARNSV